MSHMGSRGVVHPEFARQLVECNKNLTAEAARLRAALEAMAAEVKYLRAWRLWAQRELDRNDIRGELTDDPMPTPPEGVEP